MKGVVFLAGREGAVRWFPGPTPGPDEVIGKLEASGRRVFAP